MTPTPARLARLLPPPPDARPDGALLDSFLADRDEAAFAELLRRHGPLVLAACRRLLPDPADAEDAFQASFLVLVRRARRLTGAATLGPWLYRVAAWTARNVRRRNARRLARTATLPDAVPALPNSPAPALDLDAALLALPEKYRTPLVLCHLQGWSRRDAAERLGYPEGTLSSLLARGLTKLKARLRGYDPTAALAVGLTAVPAGLTAATVSAATATRAAAAVLVPPSVAELTEGVLRMFWVQNATAAAAGLAVVFALGASVGLSVREAPGVVAQDMPSALPRPSTPIPHDRKTESANPTTLDAELAAKLKELERELDRHAEFMLNVAERQRQDADRRFARGEMSRKARDAAHADANRMRERFTEPALRARAEREWNREVQERLAFQKRQRGAEATGTLAVDVVFPDAERPRVAVAARELVDRSATSTNNVPLAAWDAARRGSHVLVSFPMLASFPNPLRTAPVEGAVEIAVDLVLVPLPLTREPGGFVLVRDGDRVVRFSNYPSAAAARFQEVLSAAVPAGR